MIRAPRVPASAWSPPEHQLVVHAVDVRIADIDDVHSLRTGLAEEILQMGDDPLGALALEEAGDEIVQHVHDDDGRAVIHDVLGALHERAIASPPKNPAEGGCRVAVVAPLLFQTAFNFASYPQVPGRSTLLCGLAPVGSRRFTKSRGTSPPGGSSCQPGLCRFCALATALAVSDFRIHLTLGGGNFLSWLAPTVGRPPSPGMNRHQSSVDNPIVPAAGGR